VVGIAVGFKLRNTTVKMPVTGDLKTIMILAIIIIIIIIISPKTGIVSLYVKR
jgi:hypothetical protein